MLGTEVLSRLFHQQESLGLLKGIKISRNCSPITHILFADDFIIFAKATSLEATAIKTRLNSYYAWSGHKVNDGKSLILFNKNTGASSINTIKGIIPYKPTSSTSYYLGLPFIIGK
jgi:hypothetical protein